MTREIIQRRLQIRRDTNSMKSSHQRRAVYSVPEPMVSNGFIESVTQADHENSTNINNGFSHVPLSEEARPTIQQKESNYSAHQSISLGSILSSVGENKNASGRNNFREELLCVTQLAEAKKTKKQKEQSKADRSAYNVNAYFRDWANGKKRPVPITGEVMKLFLKVHPEGVRGHHSGDPSQGKGGNTDNDFEIFKSWYTQKYEEE